MRQFNHIQLISEQLQTIIKEAVASKFNEHQVSNPKRHEKHVTIEVVSNVFKISISTVHNFRRIGILQASQVGGRVFF